jgi:hypothetical protein
MLTLPRCMQLMQSRITEVYRKDTVAIPDKAVIVMAGVAKMFVGEIVEEGIILSCRC